MYIYINGQYVRKEEARISPFDHGFLYGLGVFETFRIYNGHPFLLDDHLERLNASLRTLNIEAMYSREEIKAILDRILEKNGLSNAYIRLNVSAGAGEIGLQTTPYNKPNMIVFSKPLPPAGEMAEKEAVLLDLKRNTPEGEVRLKSHHYMNNILAKQELGARTEAEGIFLTKEGFLAEGIVSNLFWYREGALYTPAVETGILDGITRRYVLKLAEAYGVQVHEGFFRPEDAETADEVFLTNSIQEIVRVSLFNGKRLPEKKAFVDFLHGLYKSTRESLWSRNQL